MQCNPVPYRPNPNFIPARSVESRWAFTDENLSAGRLGNAMRKGESQALGEELLDVRALNVVGLLELNNLENLFALSV